MGGGGKGSAPKPVDPYKAADAQTGSNVGTALANQVLGNVNQVTPYGTLNYNQTGSQSWTDPTSGKTYTLPTYTATTTLSKDQQKLLDTKTGTATTMAGIANNQANTLQSALGKSVSTPQLQSMTTSSGVNNKFDLNYKNQANLQANATNQNTKLKNAGKIQKGVADSGSIQKTLANSGKITSSIANAGKIGTQIADAGKIGSQIANAGQIGSKIADAGQIGSQIADAGQITKSYGTDWSSDRQRVEDALMARMQPGLDRDRANLEASLSNRGIKLGGTANDRAMQQQGTKENDARMAAILGAGQEQSRLAGIANQAASFENAAQAQQYGQNANSAAFANSAQQQQFGQNQAQLAAQNAAQQQQYGQNANDAAFANSAQAQQFGQNQAQLAAQNAGQLQQYNQNANNAAFANSAQNQQFGQNLQAGQFANAAQQQLYGQNANNMQMANAAQGQQFGQNLQSAQFTNAARQQEFTNLLNKTQFNNTAAQQEWANAVQKLGINNAARQQNFQNAQTKMSFNNNVKQQGFQNSTNNQNQQVNMMNALLSGGQVQNPNWAPTNSVGVAPTDISGMMNQNYQQQLQAYQAQQQAGGGLMGGLFGLGSSMLMMSDRRLKRDIVALGVLGDLPVYAWTYVWGGARHIGVMAQDMLRLRPAAVVRVGDYLAVDYGAL